jgi:hypothetical protein
MAELPSAVCQVCGGYKRDVNHWLVGITKPGFEGLIIQAAEACLEPRNPEFIYDDLCGDGCVHTLVSRYLDNLHRFYRDQEAPCQTN